MRIGIFGGSFNPVHNHHIRIAKTSIENYGIDEVWFVPVYQPVHKPKYDLLDFDIRVKLLEKAVTGNVRLKVSRVESELEGPSFTIRLVRHLKRTFPEIEFTLIIGGDSLADLPNWGSHESLVNEIAFAVVTRPGIPDDIPLPNPSSFWMEMQPSEISSSAIRISLCSGEMAKLPLHPAVSAEIAFSNLYSAFCSPYSDWLKTIQARETGLTEKLVNHVKGTALLAAEYCAGFGLDPRHGIIAGFSHDMFRLSPDRIILREISKSGIKLLKAEMNEPMLAHGAAAAAFLMHKCPSIPQSVITAVRWHTFPRISACRTAKSLVMADTLDPSRNKPARDALRNLPQSLDEKYLEVVYYKRRKNLKIHKRS